jgi:hypothetical protein
MAGGFRGALLSLAAATALIESGCTETTYAVTTTDATRISVHDAHGRSVLPEDASRGALAGEDVVVVRPSAREIDVVCAACRPSVEHVVTGDVLAANGTLRDTNGDVDVTHVLRDHRYVVAKVAFHVPADAVVEVRELVHYPKYKGVFALVWGAGLAVGAGAVTAIEARNDHAPGATVASAAATALGLGVVVAGLWTLLAHDTTRIVRTTTPR